ncbi:MAG: hypothetical protein K5945_01815 [Bacteroidaceae bacterium]|nr:hypothetical protein [Bacteroidaceae bacterium]
MSQRKSIALIGLLFGICVLATRPMPQHTPSETTEDKVLLLHADRLYYDERRHATAQFLVGEVAFRHGDVLMYCDSALFYEASNSFDAFGNVRMLQGDTLTLTGDVLYYNGLDQLARVRHNVVLTHRETILYTDSLDYDRLYELGYFFEGGRLVDQDNELTSDWGEYSPATREAVFNYNVRLVNPAPPAEPQTTLISDTLHYNTRTAIAHIIGPSNIEHGESHAYSELGYYMTNEKVAYLLNRSILTENGKRLVGDSLVWLADEKIGKAYGNAIYSDAVNKNMFRGHYGYYDDSIGYAEASDSAVLTDYSQRDTLYAHADTFKLFTFNLDTDSMYRVLHGYYHVRAFRNDVQAVCDSVVYSSLDTCMTMYRDPILWQQGQQLLGEEIKAFFNDSTLDSIQVLRQALSVERIDSVHYNQVAGKEMHSYFNGGELYLTTSVGNVFVNFYPFDDDSLMVGMNHVETTLLKLYLKDRKVDRIWMPAAQGTMYPVPLVPPTVLYLDNFAWFDYIRPRNKDDIFDWRPKHAGSELKQSIQRSAPKQKLSDVKRMTSTSTSESATTAKQ